jgi:hypothetical protein
LQRQLLSRMSEYMRSYMSTSMSAYALVQRDDERRMRYMTRGV